MQNRTTQSASRTRAGSEDPDPRPNARAKAIPVWTPVDFLDLGARAGVDKALQRLASRTTFGALIADSTTCPP
jgi:hypothetical protein